MSTTTTADGIRARREALGWSRARLSRETGTDAGVAEVTVWRIEHGTHAPHPRTLACIDAALLRSEEAGAARGRWCRGTGVPAWLCCVCNDCADAPAPAACVDACTTTANETEETR